MSRRVLVALALASFGLAFALALPLGSAPQQPSASKSPQMHYYLANQAFFVGDTDQAEAHMRALAADAVDVAGLCPGVPFSFEMRGAHYRFCDPDRVRMPPQVQAWVSETLDRAEDAAARGDLLAAASLAESVLDLNPYDQAARARLVTWLRSAGEGERAEAHQGKLVAFQDGRLQAIESRFRERF